MSRLTEKLSDDYKDVMAELKTARRNNGKRPAFVFDDGELRRLFTSLLCLVELENQVKLLTARLNMTEEVGAERSQSKGDKLDKTKDVARKLEKRLDELTQEHEQLASTLERERKNIRKERDQMAAQIAEMRAAWDKDAASKEVRRFRFVQMFRFHID